MMAAIHEDKLVAAIIKGSLALLLVFTLLGLTLFSTKAALGVLAGGVIGIINFLWMRRILRRILGLLPGNPSQHAILWFVVRLSLVGIILYLLMVSGRFSLIGLLVGLSTIVITIMTLSIHNALHNNG